MQYGDVIVCVSNEDYEDSLVVGHIYKVASQQGRGTIRIKHSRTTYPTKNFQMVSGRRPKFKEGDQVRLGIASAEFSRQNQIPRQVAKWDRGVIKSLTNDMLAVVTINGIDTPIPSYYLLKEEEFLNIRLELLVQQLKREMEYRSNGKQKSTI